MNTFSKLVFGAAAALCVAGASTAANAEVLTGSLATWQTTMGAWSETTSFGVPNHTAISGFTTVDGVGVGVDSVVRQIGDGWATWCCGYGGQILADYSSTSVTFTLLNPVKGFGLFVEPDPFGAHDITLTTSSGQFLTQSVEGYAGAAFFGWTGSGVTGFTLSSAQDFGAGDVFSQGGAVPEPATWAFMLMGFGGLGAMLRVSRRRQLALA